MRIIHVPKFRWIRNYIDKDKRKFYIFNGSFKGILNVLHKIDEQWKVIDALHML